MKIVSWNINMYLKNSNLITRAGDIVEQLKKIDADIICLQEASEYFLNIFNTSTNNIYTRYGHITSHCGLCVILAKSPDFTVGKSTFQCSTSICGHGINIINCHLVPSNNEKFRREQLEALAIGENQVIICGDMNMKNNEIGIYNDIALLKKNEENTWFGKFFDEKSSISYRYDRFFVKKLDTEVEYKVFKNLSYLSDHVPILLEV